VHVAPAAIGRQPQDRGEFLFRLRPELDAAIVDFEPRIFTLPDRHA
jgi:hypothetical protein